MLQGLDIEQWLLPWVRLIVLGVSLALICYVAWWIARKIMLNGIHRLAQRTKATWDDVLVERKVFRSIAYIVPALLIDTSAPLVFSDFESAVPVVQRLSEIVIVLVFVRIVTASLNAITDILLQNPQLRDKPIQSYTQLGKVVATLVAVVLIFSIVFGKSPIYFLSAMGAISAVLILVFKDTLLGFVASIQIAAIDLVRVGDWISMPKYGADGNIIEINLTTVLVRNWDNTISTIPTYHFVSDSFTNWRGMSESGGRRIKRHINIRQSSVRFADEATVERLSRLTLLSEYISERSKEIAAYNSEKKADKSLVANGRHLTNIGLFRAYAQAYLKQHTELNLELTTMVRQLQPTEKGLPIEVYCFSANKEWTVYEGIQADIMDHLLATVPTFGLEVFEDWGAPELAQK